MLGACFGVEREDLEHFVRENDIAVGAELRDFKGTCTEKVTLMKWDKATATFGRTPEDFEFLVEPTFRIAVRARDEVISELKERIEKRDFVYDLVGGITDCFLKDIKTEFTPAEFRMEKRVVGMVPVGLVKGSQILSNGKILKIKVLYCNTFFYQGFNLEFETMEPIKTVNKIAIWEANDIEKFRKPS
jgi:hypothetical protein